jgi:hypothetical protein
MMALALLLATQDAAPVEDARANEITVIGRKLREWRGHADFRKGKASCRTRKSSGDAAIDRIGCESTVQCFTAMQPRFDASQDKALAVDERKHRLETLNQELGQCFADKREAMIAALADARATQGN